MAVSAPGAPGSVWPHKSFGPSEYGWVVGDVADGVGNTVTVHLVCAAPPAGYAVVNSGVLDLNDGATGSAACPAGTVVSGGGYALAAAPAQTSAPATPGSAWPHITFGADQYGWVLGDVANGNAAPGSTVYALCAAQAAAPPDPTPAPTPLPTPSPTPPAAPPPPPATLALAADSSLVCGENATVTIDLKNATDLYGYAFQVQYDDSLVDAVGTYVNTFFEAAPATADAALCAAGLCRFALSRVEPQAPVSGAGPLARITFTPQAAGNFNLTLLPDPALTGRGAIPLPGSVAAPLPLTVCGLASAAGVVRLQGRGAPLPGGTVTLTGAGFGPYTAPIDPASGAWSISAIRVLPGGSSYTVAASHGLYLESRQAIILQPEANFDAGTIRLRGGDANGSGAIDSGDLACIGGAFGRGPQPCGDGGSSDINGDGRTNILDLVLPSGNFGRAAPEEG